LAWLPLNKAIRLARHQEKGDVTSLKYRFRKEMERSQQTLGQRMNEVKDQITRTIGRVEKTLDYEQDQDGKRGKSQGRARTTKGGGTQTAGANKRGTMPPVASVTGSREQSKRPSAAFPELTLVTQKTSRTGSMLSSSVLDADKLNQMHVRVVSIGGLNIPPSFIKYIEVKVITDYETSFVNPLPNLQSVPSFSKPGTPTHLHSTENSEASMLTSGAGAASEINLKSASSTQVLYRSKSVAKMSASIKNTRASFVLNRPRTGNRSGKDPAFFPSADPLDSLFASAPTLTYREENKKVQLRFDFLNTSPTLVHQGHLPKSDLTRINIKIQLRFNLGAFYQENFGMSIVPEDKGVPGSFGHSEYIYMGGSTIPMTTLLSKAHEGKFLDIAFTQTCFEIAFPDLSRFPHEKVNFALNHGINLDLDEEEVNRQVSDEKISATISPRNSALSPRKVMDSEKAERRPPAANYHKFHTLERGFVMLIPASDSGVLTVSSIAAHKLVQEWAFAKNTTSKKLL
jgi:hypothetical protein